MDVTALERLIAGALAHMLRSQQLAAPVLDECRPRMVGERQREDLRQAHRALILAYSNAQSATGELQEGAAILGEFLRPKGEI